MIFKDKLEKVEISKMDDSVLVSSREKKDSDFGVIFCNIITTSINPDQGEVLRINLKPCYVGNEDGQLSRVRKPVSFFSVKDSNLSEEEKSFVDFDLEEKIGSSIDWKLVKSLFEKADLVVAHNASFVRPWVDKYIGNNEVTWGCTLEHLNWTSKGFPSKNLESLSVFSGYYYDFSNSIESLDAVVNCLHVNSSFRELTEKSFSPDLQVFAANAPFESKDLLKDRKYRWNPDFSCWWIPVEDQQKANLEKAWIEENIPEAEPQIFEVEPKFRFIR